MTDLINRKQAGNLTEPIAFVGCLLLLVALTAGGFLLRKQGLFFSFLGLFGYAMGTLVVTMTFAAFATGPKLHWAWRSFWGLLALVSFVGGSAGTFRMGRDLYKSLQQLWLEKGWGPGPIFAGGFVLAAIIAFVWARSKGPLNGRPGGPGEGDT